MNITLFGGSGAIGKILTEVAIQNGDNVTLYARNAGKIGQKHEKLNVVEGQLSNQDLVEQALSNADVVISTLGPALDTSRKLKGTPVADGHEVMVNAMRKLNKKRLITLATPTLKSDKDRNSIATIVPGIMAKVMFPNGYYEMKKLEEIIKRSSLDWTVVRIINPNVRHKENVHYAYSLGDQPAKMGVSRENIAKFMYHAASEPSLIHQMPIVYNS
ncbi:NAD(P)-dependent oxidoreductase [Paenibacillus sp. FSL R10-2748]|uniref:NAD(P)-dependent oxidoreductase n=1 Tax=Paenibacillus sp. FSL R10-2748 TaxID=2954658 RepID=UPI0030F68697